MSLELVETWLEISPECKECGICTKICPVGALEVKA
jgi:ferredoxin